MSIDRWMDKEVVVYIHNGILLSHKKECIWVSSDEVDEPRTYYTEWRESERERYCILMHICEEIEIRDTEIRSSNCVPFCLKTGEILFNEKKKPRDF